MRRSGSSPDETLRRGEFENTTRSGVFLTNFEVFYLLMKHCIKSLTLFLKKNEEEKGGEIKDAKMSSFIFYLISKHSCIKHLFLWYFLYELLICLRMLGRALLAR